MFKRYRLMDEVGDASGASAAAAGDAGAAAGAAGAADAGSLLAAGAAGAPANNDYIPEKLRVTKADGTLDMDGSSRKLAEAYGALEKRFGAGDVAPKDVGEYKVAVPDAFKEAIDPTKDAGIQGFLGKALASGMTQSQVDVVMEQYFEMAPKLAGGAAQLDAAGATAELKKTWATDADFTRNVQNAYTGANAAAQKAGIDINEVMSGPLGNNPQFLRLMAALGPEFQEDKAIGASRMTSDSDIQSLMASEAYTNPKHLDHAKVSAQIGEYYKRKYGTEAA